jgi:hypothetical protein
MNSNEFNPEVVVEISKIKEIIPKEEIQTHGAPDL